MSRIGTAILVAGLVLLVAGWFLAASAHVAMPAYLGAWLLVSALPLGALPLTMALDLSGAPSCPAGLARPLRRMCWGVPVAGLLLIPILVAYGPLYSAPHRGFTTPFARWWLAPAPFVVRSVVYLVVWSLLGLVFATPPRADRVGRRCRLAALGLALYVVLGTLAAVDWAMTTEGGWSSPVFGLIFLSVQVLIALPAATLLAGAAWRRQMADRLALLLLVASAIWLFLEFIQFLIVWSADLPREVVWYLHRDAGGGRIVEWIGFVGGFLIPAVVLGTARLRRQADAVGWIAALLLVVHALEMLWLATPSYRHYFTLRGLDILGIVGLLGVLTGVLLLAVARRGPAPEAGHG